MNDAMPHRPPVSTGHAFARAFDLAVRRDPVHSLLVPLLLRAPWVLALALLPSADDPVPGASLLLLSCTAVLGDFLVLLLVGAMLRFRARSVHDAPPDTPPRAVGACYADGLRRLPWLFVTEVVRAVVLFFAFIMFVIPAVFLGFRLSVATEAVVLDEPTLAGAFGRSFRVTAGRFGSWLAMLVRSVLLGLAAILAGAALSLALPGDGKGTGVALDLLLLALVTPVIQYAWAFFYLRLAETELPEGREVVPLYAGPVPAVGTGGPEPPGAPTTGA